MRLASILFFLLFFVNICISSEKLTTDELVKILGLKVWKLPMPKGKNWEWGIKIVNKVTALDKSKSIDKYFSNSETGILSLQPLRYSKYQFVFLQRKGRGSGEIKIKIKGLKKKKVPIGKDPVHILDRKMEKKLVVDKTKHKDQKPDSTILEIPSDNNYAITWHDIPLWYGEKKIFVIADIRHMMDNKILQQIIIYPGCSSRPCGEI